MGFRSTFVTDEFNIFWPAWFAEKYKDFVHFPLDYRGCISSKREAKTYTTFSSLEEDIQKVLGEPCQDRHYSLLLVYLHECGGVTRCDISSNRILYTQPSDWEVIDGIQHLNCYGCSDV
jgi:hypothetical protein